MAFAQDKPAMAEGDKPAPGVILVRAACVALLLGLPPVLEFPGALAVSCKALAFSGARTLVALGLLAGMAISHRLPERASSRIRHVGVAAVAAYAALMGAALLGALDVSIDWVICLGIIANALALGASLTCSASFVCRPAVVASAGENPVRALARILAFVLASLGILTLSVGCEPRWTVVRMAFAGGGFDAANCWHVLVYSLNGIAGPGPHLLDAGVNDLDFRIIALLLAWLGASIAAAASDVREGDAAGVCGLALGVIAVKCLAALFPAFTDGVAFGFAAMTAGVTLFICCAATRQNMPAKNASACSSLPQTLDLSPLSPREREAVEGRLAKMTSAEVARQMGVSASTVRNLQARAVKKLGVESLDELAAATEPARVEAEPAGRRAVPQIAIPVAVLGAAAFGSACIAAARADDLTPAVLMGEASLAVALATAALSKAQHSAPGLTSRPALCGLGALTGVCMVAAATMPDALLAKIVLAGLVLAAFALTLVAPAISARFPKPWLADLFAQRLAPLTFASFCAGAVACLALLRPLVMSGDLLALAVSTDGIAAVASLATLAIGAIAVVGLISAVAVARGLLAGRKVSGLRESAPDFEGRVRALCRLHGLSSTCAEVTICLLEGMNGPAIRTRLCIASGTLNSAKREIYRSFAVHSGAALAARVSEYLEAGAQR